jgi:hypothetical protein
MPYKRNSRNFIDYPDDLKEIQKKSNNNEFFEWKPIFDQWEKPASNVNVREETCSIRDILEMMSIGRLYNSDNNRGANSSVIEGADYFNILKVEKCKKKFENALEMSAWKLPQMQSFICRVMTGQPLASMRMLKFKKGRYTYYEQWDGRNRCLTFIAFISGRFKIRLPTDELDMAIYDYDSSVIEALFYSRGIVVKMVDGGIKSENNCKKCTGEEQPCDRCQTYINAHCYISEDTYGANQGAKMVSGDKVGLLSFDTTTNRYLNKLSDMDYFNGKELLIMQHGSHNTTLLDIVMNIDINISKNIKQPKNPRSEKTCVKYLGNVNNTITHTDEIALFCTTMKEAICTPEGMSTINALKNTPANANKVFNFLRSKIPTTYEAIRLLKPENFDWNMLHDLHIP